MGKRVYLAMAATLLAGMCSGAAGAWVYLSAAYNDLIIKYTQSVSDYNMLSVKHSRTLTESIRKEAQLTEEVLSCNQRLFDAVKVECNRERKVYKKRKKK